MSEEAKTQAENNDGELHDDELKQVAGGTGPGNVVSAQGDNQILIGLLLPAVQKVREAASRSDGALPPNVTLGK